MAILHIDINVSSITFDSGYNLIPTSINNKFFNTIEMAFNSLNKTAKNILYLIYFNDETTSTSVAYRLFISRSIVYRTRDKALVRIAKSYSQLFLN